MVAAEAAACGTLPISAAHSGLAEVTAPLAAAAPEPARPWLSFPVGDGAVSDLAERIVALAAGRPTTCAPRRATRSSPSRASATRGTGWRRGSSRPPRAISTPSPSRRSASARTPCEPRAAGRSRSAAMVESARVPRQSAVRSSAGRAVARRGQPRCPAAGRQRQSNADLVAGKQLFVAKCGSCHTLARAGTKGTSARTSTRRSSSRSRTAWSAAASAGSSTQQIPPRPSTADDPQQARSDARGPRQGRGRRATSPPTWRPSRPTAARTRACWPSAVQAGRQRQAGRAKNGTLTIAAPTRTASSPTSRRQRHAPAGQMTVEMPNKSGVAAQHRHRRARA